MAVLAKPLAYLGDDRFIQRSARFQPSPSHRSERRSRRSFRALAEDPYTALVLLAESTSAGAEVDPHIRGTCGKLAMLVAATAPSHLSDVPQRTVQIGSLSLVAGIERVLVEWRDGYLDATIDELIEHLTQVFLVAWAPVGCPRVQGEK